MSCTTLFECQTLLQDLLIENNKLESCFLQLNIDITFRRDMLSTWQQAPIELQAAAEIAYNDSLNKYEIILNAYKQLINLKDVLNHINDTLNNDLNNSTPSNLKLNLININNLITNYNELKNTFLTNFKDLLDA
jgi:hypothetical protein